ncbi:hypothetical protein F8388_025695 [Cannabis sativa]|uniref:Uncharacterized protein n=1 Tax=Cannabis sativa TaxID=3483 RepID=A0A7J6DLC2_CANSA|nr:hypothetical protein G4B88_015483 [Cannabis sativa]KAF4376824.1 hypothetical protein F8388_025695 [Cannabis sativa]
MVIAYGHLILSNRKRRNKESLDLEWPWPILQIIILLNLSSPLNWVSPKTLLTSLTTFNISIILQEKSQSQHNPFQTKYQHTQSTSQFQNHSTIFFSNIRLKIPKKIPSPTKYKNRNRALEDSSEHSSHHVSPIPLPRTPRGRGTARNSSDDGDDVEEDEEDSTH